MESISQTAGAYFKSLKVLHSALLGGIVFFAVVSIALQQDGAESVGGLVDMLMPFFIPVLSVAGIVGGDFVFKSRLQRIAGLDSLKDKMDGYRSALIIKFALIEGPALLTIIAFIQTGRYLYLGIALLLLMVFVYYSPKKSKLISDLQLTKNDSDLLDNPESEII
ncbi:MAG: hypothetical protein IPL46_13710 [Saprospiraceae bacterium]|nr:hypothetical protein [Saprospiraceae bacterium]